MTEDREKIPTMDPERTGEISPRAAHITVLQLVYWNTSIKFSTLFIAAIVHTSSALLCKIKNFDISTNTPSNDIIIYYRAKNARVKL